MKITVSFDDFYLSTNLSSHGNDEHHCHFGSGDVHRSRIPVGQWLAMDSYFHDASRSPVTIDTPPFLRDMTDVQRSLYSSTMGIFREIWAAQDRLENDE